jgi:hypothetical protein
MTSHFDPLKRLHPVLNRPFRRGDLRGDGFVFNTYQKTKIGANGFYKEQWLSPDAFRRYQTSSKKAIKACYRRQITNRRKLIDQIKLDSGCCICGYNSHAVALDFDHLNPAEKDFTIGNKYAHKPWQTILDEIEKCRILCANCHRVETLKQQVSSI